jgi:hypothetical protein
MNRNVFAGAFFLGAIAVIWVAVGFAGSNHLALLITAVIGTVYGFGALELRRFREVTAALVTALRSIPANLVHLETWLHGIDPSVQNQVRQRIEGERVGLPGPVLTPYLVGLLVMLGMLGTFLGMVVTLKGAVFALEGTTDLQAIRSAFAEPIRGLGLSFGTSVAGVAASAMLGLMSAISRRERLMAAQLLDSKVATDLRCFSLNYQRQESFRALQDRSKALPAVVEQLQQMMTRMEGMSQQLNDRLLGNQEEFHKEVRVVYRELAQAVDQSLRTSLAQSAQAASESIRPVVVAAMSGLSEESRLVHARMVASTQEQLDRLGAGLSVTASSVTQAWSANLAEQERTSAAMIAALQQSMNAWAQDLESRSIGILEALKETSSRQQADQSAQEQQRLEVWTQSLDGVATSLKQGWQQIGTDSLVQQQRASEVWVATAQELAAGTKAAASQTLDEVARLMTSFEDLVRTRIDSEATWSTQQNERMELLVATLRTELSALRDDEAARGKAAVDRLGDLQADVRIHLTTLGTALEEPIAQLINTASEAPRAAAEVIGKLRQEVSNSAARDNELLEERSRILGTLNTLLEAINHASVEQRAVIDALVASSAVTLNNASTQFVDKVQAEAAKLEDIAASVTSSAVEVSTLGDTFGFSVRSFNEANERLIGNLQRIEAALGKSMARSDEQLAYYVAQAREIIDLSIMSQKGFVDQIAQLPVKKALVDREVIL